MVWLRGPKSCSRRLQNKFLLAISGVSTILIDLIVVSSMPGWQPSCRCKSRTISNSLAQSIQSCRIHVTDCDYLPHMGVPKEVR